MAWDPKDADEVLDYVLDWADRLANGDTINTSTWAIVETSPTLVIDSSSKTNSTTTVWLSGGTTGETYHLRNRVVTAGGRTMDKTMKLKIKEK